MIKQEANEFDRSLVKSLQEIHQDNQSFRITTMTIGITLGYTKCFYLKKLYDWFVANNILTELSNSDNGFWSLREFSGFYNCVILYKSYVDNSNKKRKIAVKLFKNCKLHMTGIKSCSDALEHANKLIGVLDKFYMQQNLHIKGFSVQLINGHYRLPLPEGFTLCLQSLLDKLQNTDCKCIFNSDQHPGIRIKLSIETTTVTLIIFESGNILVTAFINSNQLEKSYSFLSTYIHSNLSRCLKPQIKQKPSRKKMLSFDYTKYKM